MRHSEKIFQLSFLVYPHVNVTHTHSFLRISFTILHVANWIHYSRGTLPIRSDNTSPERNCVVAFVSALIFGFRTKIFLFMNYLAVSQAFNNNSRRTKRQTYDSVRRGDRDFCFWIKSNENKSRPRIIRWDIGWTVSGRFIRTRSFEWRNIPRR